MATIINNPANQGSDDGSSTALIVGIFIVLFLGLLFFIYGLPMLRATEEERQPAQNQIEIQGSTPVKIVTTPTQEPAQ